MFKEVRNELCVRLGKFSQRVLGRVARWAAKKASLDVIDMTGLKLVNAEATLLPEGCRAIPQHHYNVDPDVLRQLKDGNRAILHQAMKNWQVSNEHTGKVGFLKGDQWGTKSDPKTWHQTIFPFLNIKTVKTMIADLEAAALLVVDGAWCQSVKAEISGTEQLALSLGKDFQQPRKFFPSSIQSKSNSSKIKTRKSTSINTRKDAVADFQIPETRNAADVEMREGHDAEVEGCDVLHELPGALVTAWTDAKLPLEQLVAQHGVERVKDKWQEAEHFKNRVAGLRTLLSKTPTPVPPPPSPDESTQSDSLFDEEATPDIDDFDIKKVLGEPANPDTQRQTWLQAHVAPELLATMGGAW